MKLSTKAWLATFAVFVGTMPHAVGAMLSQQQQAVKESAIVVKAKPTLIQMKQLAKRYGRTEVIAMYGSNKEWKALFTLWNRESRWDYTAKNKHSSAFGIPQMLKLPHDTGMTRQIDLGLKYIKARYGTPSAALAFHNRNGWY
jgi:hypothetical protein